MSSQASVGKPAMIDFRLGEYDMQVVRVLDESNDEVKWSLAEKHPQNFNSSWRNLAEAEFVATAALPSTVARWDQVEGPGRRKRPFYLSRK